MKWGTTIVIVVLGLSSAGYGVDVNYSGFIHDPYPNSPVGDFVIAGTFDPTFNPWDYPYVYGDWVGNLVDGPEYAQAVADGVFRPIGAGTLTTDGAGSFSGTGSTTGIVGEALWIFAFGDPAPDDAWTFALCTSSDPGWLASGDAVGDQNVLHSSEADVFVFGGSAAPAIALQGLPIPVPSAGAAGLAGLVWVCGRRR
ncbi:MAG: hypothetical protein CMJ49_00745 [Planctomycetaceae bacterium]|nr:hypothetical protein [Planctomycetaceae bacterium]